MFTLNHVLITVAILSPFVIGAPLSENENNDGGNSERIWGGQKAVKGQFPFQVSLRIGHRHVCGGSIITNRFVITAAHCHFKEHPEPKAYRIAVGGYVRNSETPNTRPSDGSSTKAFT